MSGPHNTPLSPEAVARDYLSLHAWLCDTVLAVAITLTMSLFALMALESGPGLPAGVSDALALIGGCLAVGACAHRGMDIAAFRAAHDALMEHYPDGYRKRLMSLTQPPRSLSDVGATLHWIEMELGLLSPRR